MSDPKGTEPQGGLSSLVAYRGTSPIRNASLLGPYNREYMMSGSGPSGRGAFLMSEVPLYWQPRDEGSESQ